MKTDLDECLMIQNQSTVEDESWFEHVVIDTLVVIRLKQHLT